jgi:hypothetical protein
VKESSRLVLCCPTLRDRHYFITELEWGRALDPHLLPELMDVDRSLEEPSSSHIMLPSHAAALLALEKLRDVEFENGCKPRINWFRTYPDAEMFWTRQLGYD